MNPRDDLDRMLGALLDDPYAAPTSRILGRVLERTQQTRQQRAWTSLERWLPMAVITRPALAPPLRAAWLLILALLLVALAAGGAVVGSRLLLAPVQRAVLPAVIPQGDEAVFAYTWKGEIFIVRADGTDIRQLTDGNDVTSPPVWSPDGTRLAYRSGQDSVAVIDAGGGDPTILATCEPPAVECDSSLAWSPDGSSLVFATSGGGTFDLSIVAADGSSPATRLLAPGLHSVNAAWSPDGTKLAYLASDLPGRAGLYVADVTAQDALVGGVEGDLVRPDLGPNLGFGGSGWQPQWSPDGTQLAVTVYPQEFFLGNAEGIDVVQADGSGGRLLTERAGHATWSPDGRRVAFHRTVDPSEYVQGRPCTARTWVIDADGSDERELAELGDECSGPPLWSPDGTRLASVLHVQTPDDPLEGVPFHLGFVTVDGSNPPVLLQDAYGSWQPVVAPLPPARTSPAASSAP